MTDKQIELLKAALAVLAQHKTYPADINYAKQLISECLEQEMINYILTKV